MAVPDAVQYRLVQQGNVLRDDTDLLADAGLRILGDVLTVDQDPSRGRVPEAKHEFEEGGLAAACGSDNTNG